MACANDVTLLCLPAHTLHILQPLDVGVFKSFKTSFNEACGNYMTQHPGRVITTDVLASMVAQAYPTSFTPVNVLSGFKKAGVYTFNPSEVDQGQILQIRDCPGDSRTVGAMHKHEEPLISEDVISVFAVNTRQGNVSDIMMHDGIKHHVI